MRYTDEGLNFNKRYRRAESGLKVAWKLHVTPEQEWFAQPKPSYILAIIGHIFGENSTGM